MAKRGLNLTIKGLIVGTLILLLLIPALFISNTINERSERQQEVAQEVSSKWAGHQTLTGPILIIPYIQNISESVIDASTKRTTEVTRKQRQLCYILPEELKIDGQLDPQIRKRSIYKIAVYQTNVKLSGTFAPVDFEELGLTPENMLWNEAQVCLGMSDFRGIEEQITMKWDSTVYPLSTGMIGNGVLETGLSFKPTGLTADGHTFSVELHLRGSEQFYMTPVGKTTDVTLTSAWADPSFSGNFLPNEPAEVTEKGFTAQWKILHLNREYPQSWAGDAYDLKEYEQNAMERSEFGVDLLQPTDSYAKTERSVKYAILFIALTFVLYFLLEILQKREVHPLQYVLVGLALCLFYTLLLSIGEYTGFNTAYLIAATATIGLIAWYSNSIFKKRGIALLMGGTLALLYGFIFILLQLQDGALLFGSIGLFIILALIMYYSHKIDWQKEDKPQEA